MLGTGVRFSHAAQKKFTVFKHCSGYSLMLASKTVGINLIFVGIESYYPEKYMVTIAQLAERRIVVPNVVGSSPTGHPKIKLLWIKSSQKDS